MLYHKFIVILFILIAIQTGHILWSDNYAYSWLISKAINVLTKIVMSVVLCLLSDISCHFDHIVKQKFFILEYVS